MSEKDVASVVNAMRDDWNAAANAWEKWDPWLEKNMSFLNERLLAAVRVRPGHRLLDLGSGTGSPSIDAAKLVGEEGSVTGVDIAEDMLLVASKKARSLNLSNITFKSCHTDRLPFPDNSFDAATSRFCLMFLPHLDETLHESLRVLKPGCFMTAAVWAAPDRNPSFTIPAQALGKFTKLPAPAPSSPSVFSLATPGELKKRMEETGFENVEEAGVHIEWVFASGDEYFENFRDMAAPIRPYYEKLDEANKELVRKEIIESAEFYRQDGRLKIPGIAIMVTGQKKHPGPA